MKAIRNIKVKIGESERFDKLAIRYLRAANWLSKKVFKSKELNSNRLSNDFYGVMRRKFNIPSQLTGSLCRVVTASYKTQISNERWFLATFKRPVLPICRQRDFNTSQRNGVRILGEIVTLQHPSIPPIPTWRDSKIKRVGNTWFLLLAHEIEVPEPKTEGCIVGVDFGIKRLMVATNSNNSKPFFFRGGTLNHVRTGIRRTRAQVQAVGTRSSRRLLRRMAGHEAAVTGHMLHIAAKALITYAVENNARKIVLEDLSNVRDASLNKGKDMRAKIHRWPYAQAQFFIGYKAQAVGIETAFVNPANTSRGCARCGHVAASNRNGLDFCCKKCGHKDDADRNASSNIRLRFVSSEHDSLLSGRYNPPKNSELLEIKAESPVSDDDLVMV